MTPEKDKKLVEAFPNLYRDRNGSMYETCMCWGFDVGDGWFDIIWELSEEIEGYILDHDLQGQLYAVQVKEKFGGLRFYLSESPDEVDKWVDEAEDKAWKTCEVCGNPGTLRKGGWWVTHCDTCNAAWEEKKKKKEAELEKYMAK